jgi:hypothetical protein
MNTEIRVVEENHYIDFQKKLNDLVSKGFEFQGEAHVQTAFNKFGEIRQTLYIQIMKRNN